MWRVARDCAKCSVFLTGHRFALLHPFNLILQARSLPSAGLRARVGRIAADLRWSNRRQDVLRLFGGHGAIQIEGVLPKQAPVHVDQFVLAFALVLVLVLVFQGNCTLMRPSASVQTFSPSGLTSSATCGPPVCGLAWLAARFRAGRRGSVMGWAVRHWRRF